MSCGARNAGGPGRLAGCSGRRRIGLLGGSFNPAHDGHLYISRVALARLGLDEIWWLVSPGNPLKSDADLASFANRLAAARATARDPRIRVTDIEARLGTRFTVDTIRCLKRRCPRTRFVWLIGADNLIQIPRWRRWETLFQSVPIAVLTRRPYSLKALSGLAARRFARYRIPGRMAGTLAGREPPAWVFLDTRAHPAAATAIRRTRARSGAAGRKPPG